MKSWQVWVGVVVLFLAGAVTGICGAAAWIHHEFAALHQHGPGEAIDLGLLRMVDWKLDLEDHQTEEILAALRDVHRGFLVLHSRQMDAIHDVVDPAFARIDAALTEEQRPAWRSVRESFMDHLAEVERLGKRLQEPPPKSDD